MTRQHRPGPTALRTLPLLIVVGLASCSPDAMDVTTPIITSVVASGRGGGGGGGGKPSVTGANPSSVPKGMVNVDLEITGTGFTSSSTVAFELDGSSTDAISTNSVVFLDETRLIANVDVSEEALETFYDIAVRNGPKKKGVGIDLLLVSSPTPADPAIAFVVRGTLNELRVVDASGAHETTIWQSSYAGFAIPTWSPDGSKILIKDFDLITLDVSVVDGIPVASNPVVLPDLPNTTSAAPDWAPDGSEIAFFGTEGTSTYGIWVMASDGSGANRIYTAPAGTRVRYPTWSPDGSQIAFIQRNLDPEGRGDDYHPVLTVINRTGGTVAASRAFTEFGNVLFPTWQRTAGGTLLAIEARAAARKARDRKYHVYIVDPFTGGAPDLIDEGGHPTWSSDDSEVAFISSNGKLVAFNRATGATRTVSNSNAHGPDWMR